jgi:hypothetical protein
LQVRVMAREVVAKIMEGYFIAPYSASKEVWNEKSNNGSTRTI